MKTTTNTDCPVCGAIENVKDGICAECGHLTIEKPEKEVSDTELLALIQQAEVDLQAADRYLRGLRLTFIQRMEKKAATKYEDPFFKVSLVPKLKREFNDQVLSRLADFIPADDFRKCVKTRMEWAWGALKELRKLGGEIGFIIENGVAEIPQAPALEIKQKEVK